jgi:hypothetical protein
MTSPNVTEINHNIIEKEHINFCWKDNLPIQHLLHAISSILAEEYIAVTKQNPDVFLKYGDPK